MPGDLQISVHEEVKTEDIFGAFRQFNIRRPSPTAKPAHFAIPCKGGWEYLGELFAKVPNVVGLNEQLELIVVCNDQHFFAAYCPDGRIAIFHE